MLSLDISYEMWLWMCKSVYSYVQRNPFVITFCFAEQEPAFPDLEQIDFRAQLKVLPLYPIFSFIYEHAVINWLGAGDYFNFAFQYYVRFCKCILQTISSS